MLPMATRANPPKNPKGKAPGVDEGTVGPLKLRRTEVPGVFRNQDGLQVDERGVLLSLRQVQQAEATLDEEIIGEPVTSPAQLLKRVALDPTLPMYMRLAAATSAAPYFDRKMPTALEGSDGPPIKTQSSVLIKNLNALAPADRKAALDLLEKLGVLGGSE